MPCYVIRDICLASPKDVIKWHIKFYFFLTIIFCIYFLSVKVHLVSVSNEVRLVMLFGVKLTT